MSCSQSLQPHMQRYVIYVKLLEIIIKTWVLPPEGGSHVPLTGGVFHTSEKDRHIL